MMPTGLHPVAWTIKQESCLIKTFLKMKALWGKTVTIQIWKYLELKRRSTGSIENRSIDEAVVSDLPENQVFKRLKKVLDHRFISEENLIDVNEPPASPITEFQIASSEINEDSEALGTL